MQLKRSIRFKREASMLEFIVLGQIPGTSIQITFAWVLFAALGLTGYVTHKFKNHPLNKKTSQSNKQLTLFS